MTASLSRPMASELAGRWLDAGNPLPLGLTTGLAAEDWRALAWTLKDLCYAAWSSEPQRASRAAEALHELCGLGRGEPGSAVTGRGPPERPAARLPRRLATEMEALAAWTAGIAQLTRGEMLAATRSFDRAAQLFVDIDQAPHATQTQVPKIMALEMLGQHDQAVACAETAREQFLAQRDLRAASKVSLNLGSLHLGRDAHGPAARHYREAAVLFARVADHEHSVMADIGLADTLVAMGDFDEASRIYARARMRAAAHKFPVLEAMVDESQALLELARGAYREALAGFERSRRGYELLAMPQHLAIAEKQLGDAYLELRLLPEALALYEKAVARFEELDAPDELAWALTQQGRTEALLDRPACAAASLQRAHALFHAQGAPVGEAAVGSIRSELASAQGQSGLALSLADAASRAFADAGLPQRQARADVLRARALLGLGRHAASAELFDAGLQRARELGLAPIEVSCLSGRGCAALALGHTEAAIADFLSAVELFEEQRRALPGDEFQRAFLGGHLRPYEELLRLALRDHQQSGDAAHAYAVLEWQERYRARALGEQIAQADAQDDDASLAAQRTRLNWLYRRVQDMQDEGEPVLGLADEIRRAEFELLEQSRRGRLSAGAALGQRGFADSADDPFDPRALQQLLGAEEAVVEYGVLDGELFAVVLTRSQIDVQRHLAPWTDVNDAVRSARFQFESLRSGDAPLARHRALLTQRATQRMQRLHTLIWAPLAQALAPMKRIMVVPCATLGSVPFSGLLEGDSALGSSVDLAVVPSARVALHGLRERPRPVRHALVFGETSRLQHARAEAEAVANLFPSATLCLGEHASLANLRALAPRADAIHLACHAQFRGDNPVFSALHLHDGALTVQAAQSLRLQRCTVVLSACETALADQGSGDEMVGLVRAFLVAGAARVVASLWPVDDHVTAKFMGQFHAALARHQTPAAALRIAQSAVRKDHPHPGHWAAFTLFGGW